MALDTSSFNAYLQSLNIGPYTPKRDHRFMSGPPAWVVEMLLRLGLGPLFFNTPRTRELFEELGLDYDVGQHIMERLHSRTMWWPLWEEMAIIRARAALRAAEGAALGTDSHTNRQTALASIRAALLMFLVGLSGDGFYFYAPVQARWKTYSLRRRLFALNRKLTHAHTERLWLDHARGQTAGLLQYPPGTVSTARSLPALVGIHPLSSDKETFDYCLSHFRAAGYATLCIDLPGHGENFHQQNLTADSEWVAIAALEALAQPPALDPRRLGVIGGSLGAHFALRTAAASPLAQACLAFATPYDLAALAPTMMPGIIEHFAWTVGETDRAKLLARSAQFHLCEVLEDIHCPLCLVHGTQDSVCDFTDTYTIVSQLSAPATVIPLPGLDHEVAYPVSAPIAQGAVNWLLQTL